MQRFSASPREIASPYGLTMVSIRDAATRVDLALTLASTLTRTLTSYPEVVLCRAAVAALIALIPVAHEDTCQFHMASCDSTSVDAVRACVDCPLLELVKRTDYIVPSPLQH